jgi:hypothetical protein
MANNWTEAKAWAVTVSFVAMSIAITLSIGILSDALNKFAPVQSPAVELIRQRSDIVSTLRSTTDEYKRKILIDALKETDSVIIELGVLPISTNSVEVNNESLHE